MRTFLRLPFIRDALVSAYFLVRQWVWAPYFAIGDRYGRIVITAGYDLGPATITDKTFLRLKLRFDDGLILWVKKQRFKSMLRFQPEGDGND